MADFLGPLTMPSTKLPAYDAVSGAGEAAGDPLLTRLLRFLTTYYVTDKNVTEAWKSVSKQSPIRKNFPYDPQECDFDEKWLPAVFLHRYEIGPDELVAAELTFRKTTLHLRYIFEPATQDKLSLRLPFMNAIASATSVALRRGRTSGLIVKGDTDPAAAYLGSWIGNIIGGGFRRIWCGKTSYKPFKPKVIAGTDLKLARDTYPSFVTEILIEESSKLDPATGTFPFTGGVTGTIAVNDPSFVLEMYSFKLTLTGVLPASGPAAGGTAVTLNGTSFWDNGAVAVTFGGVAATDVVVVSGNQITCTTPAHAAGAVDVVLSNGDGEVVTLAGGYTFT